MHLRDRAVNPPARPHLAPMEDELLLNRIKFHFVSSLLSIQKLQKFPQNASKKSSFFFGQSQGDGQSPVGGPRLSEPQRVLMPKSFGSKASATRWRTRCGSDQSSHR